MRKVCKKHGVESWMADPYWIDNTVDFFPEDRDFDAVIVMTPHDEFVDHKEMAYSLSLFKRNCIVADIWKMFPESKLSNTGIYRVSDYVQFTDTQSSTYDSGWL